MSDQLSLLDGELRKERGMAQADGAADPTWRTRLDLAIEYLAGIGDPFTAEDARGLAGDPPDHANAMGSRFSSAAKRGLIRSIGFRKATRPSLHTHVIREWVGTAKARESA